ncbi:MAG: HAD hydrolase-like protein [Phycisphaeraceae bacterium]|nr:HAD hydrolase-like protein [Phycisphaerales bacterium]MCB9860744.1 HAD hydrolase-like protein [Phycisphaeraceae bacterium]
MPGLVLFDIDGTLLLTKRAGMEALRQAGVDLFGDQFTDEGVEYAGCIDVLIVRALLERNGVEPSPDHCAALRAGYHKHLQPRLAESGRAYALPGAIDLVHAVRQHDDLVCGLLTGNFAETGTLKLNAAGYDADWFSLKVWGDDSPHDPPSRNHLPGVAMQRMVEHAGDGVDPSHCVIVGDTPHDVMCAKAHGMRCVGVATGGSSVADLAEAGADIVVESLQETQRLLSALLSPQSAQV